MALFAAQKAQTLGATVVAMSDSSGFVVDEFGIDIEPMKQIKLGQRGRISEYAKSRSASVRFSSAGSIWDVPVAVGLPCATQNEINGQQALTLVRTWQLSCSSLTPCRLWASSDSQCRGSHPGGGSPPLRVEPGPSSMIASSVFPFGRERRCTHSLSMTTTSSAFYSFEL